MKRSIKTLGRIAALAGIAMLVSCGGNKQQQRANTPVAYKTVKVKAEDRTIDTKYSATIRGRQDIQVMPQVSGTLQQLLVKEGQRVHRGQTMFIIDQVPYQAALNTARANLTAAKAAEATAKLSFESTKNLADQQIVSDFDLQTAANAYAQAQSDSRSVVKAGKEYKVSVLVSVYKDQLRRDLESRGVIRGLSSGF